ncbi:HD domain-containing phosphohydrolase [Dechloromonas sp. ZY10]|uniref:HD domain-containing phosphohydrolase n=1 Tax=Dechloromonas aquae TaxID=2664436 RepID=UPI003527B9B2
MQSSESGRPIILIADDEAAVLLVLEEMLESDYRVLTFSNGCEVLAYLQGGGKADLILSDIMMPEMDGLALCRACKAMPERSETPLLFISDLESEADESLALSLGAEDFIHKPFRPRIVHARVRNHLAFAQARMALRQRNDWLEREVSSRTEQIRLRGRELMASHEATIVALCALAEARDNETGNHVLRTQYYVKALGEALQKKQGSVLLSDEALHMIVRSAPLHDIGKVAIPDAVLLKPGKLDAAEWEIMQRHCEIGEGALAQAITALPEKVNSYLYYGKEIAGAHHERWDGSGYPRGLCGEEIPLSARLMAVADVYDALISRRVYKPAISHLDAVAMILQGAGSHFDPEIIEVFATVADEFARIAARYCD